MTFRVLSHSTFDHIPSYFEGVCGLFNTAAILTLLDVTLFFENGDQKAVFAKPMTYSQWSDSDN